jgi:hypothetical protein
MARPTVARAAQNLLGEELAHKVGVRSCMALPNHPFILREQKFFPLARFTNALRFDGLRYVPHRPLAYRQELVHKRFQCGFERRASRSAMPAFLAKTNSLN